MTPELTDAEAGLFKGIALIVVIKVVVVGWLGFDMEAIYVWPWTWLRCPTRTVGQCHQADPVEENPPSAVGVG